MNTKELKDKVKYYSSLPYTIVIKRRDDQGIYYVAEYLELPYLGMTGKTPEEAIRELESVKPDWIETHLEQGLEMPMPLKSRKYNGTIIMRTTPDIHECLIRMSQLQGVSLNQYMVGVVSRFLGRDETKLADARKNGNGRAHKSRKKVEA